MHVFLLEEFIILSIYIKDNKCSSEEVNFESKNFVLLLSQLDIGTPLPDPTTLVRKIIVKNKKKHMHQRGKTKNPNPFPQHGQIHDVYM